MSGEWTPERDAALVERLAYLRERFPHYLIGDFAVAEVADLHAAYHREAALLVQACSDVDGLEAALAAAREERDAAQQQLAEGGPVLATHDEQVDRVMAAYQERDAAVARVERAEREALHWKGEAEQAEADRDAHAAEARDLRTRVERLVQGATAHRERAERAEALLREALAEVEGEPGDTHEALSFALLDRIRAHLSARPPEVDREECVYCGPDGDCEYGHEHLSARPPGDALNRTERDTARTALQHLAPWAVALLDAGLVRAAGGWYHPGGVVAIWAANGRWWTSAVVVLETEPYPTEEEAARAWLAARGSDAR